MAVDRVGADADDQSVFGNDGFVCIPEATRLDGSALGEILQIEVKHHVLQAEPVGQREQRPVFQGTGEIGGLLVNLEQLRSEENNDRFTSCASACILVFVKKSGQEQ